jgi:tetratricopeptide (TPR) repeat protein
LASNLAGSYRRLAELYAQRDNLNEALAKYESGIAIQERLVARDPENSVSLLPLASLYAGVGDILSKEGKLADALTQHRKAYEARQKLARKDLHNPGPQNNLAKEEISVADLLVAQKQNLDEALKLYRDAIVVLDDARPRSRYDTNIIDAYIQIGDILLLRSDREGALRGVQESLGDRTGEC